MVPSEGARWLICARACSSRWTSYFALALACSAVSTVALLRAWSDFCFASASRSFCWASSSLSLASSPSIFDTISCLLASNLAASTSKPAFNTAVLSSSSVSLACARACSILASADLRAERNCARSCSVLVLSNSTTTSPAFTEAPSVLSFTICRSPASAGALMVTDLSAFTSPRNCSESRNSPRFTRYVGIAGVRCVSRAAPKTTPLPATKTRVIKRALRRIHSCCSRVSIRNHLPVLSQKSRHWLTKTCRRQRPPKDPASALDCFPRSKQLRRKLEACQKNFHVRRSERFVRSSPEIAARGKRPVELCRSGRPADGGSPAGWPELAPASLPDLPPA